MSCSLFTLRLGSALPLLQHNVTTNATLFAHSSVRPTPSTLDWDEALPEQVRSVGGYDAIIMADVTYNTASFPALVRTLDTLIGLSSSGKSPTIILGYKERDLEERTLWEMVKGIGVALERVGERVGAGREPVEFWIGSCIGHGP